MNMKRKSTRWFGGTLVVGTVAAFGLMAGAAYAGSVPDPVGIGVSPAAGPGESIETPDYPVNAAGETYGSAADAASPDEEPDLILVVTSDGTQGYARKVDLDLASGAVGVNSKADAIAANKDNAKRFASPGGVAVPVYESDGTTVVGKFALSAAVTSAAG